MKRRAVLEMAQDAEDRCGSLVAYGPCTRRDIMRCVAAGLMESVGMVVFCDGDGMPYEPEQLREGFKLTAAGRAAL